MHEVIFCIASAIWAMLGCVALVFQWQLRVAMDRENPHAYSRLMRPFGLGFFASRLGFTSYGFTGKGVMVALRRTRITQSLAIVLLLLLVLLVPRR